MLQRIILTLALLTFSSNNIAAVSHSLPPVGNKAGINVAEIDRRATIVASDNQTINIDFELNDLEVRRVIKDNETFEIYGLPGEGIIWEHEKPVLPMVCRFVVVPPDKGIELVVEVGESRWVDANEAPVLCDDVEAVAVFSTAKNDNSNDRQERLFCPVDNSLYPPVVAEMSAPSIVRGVRIVKIMTYPIQYDAANNRYLHNEGIQTELRFTDAEPINPVLVPIRRNRSADFLKYISSIAINGNQVGRDDPDRDAEPEYIGHYCIASHPTLIQYAGRFIEWRRKSGYKVDILDLSSGGASSSGTVSSEIRGLYNEYLEDGVDPFDLLMLIGDRPRYTHGPGVGAQLASNGQHTDFPYGLIEGNDQDADVGLSRIAAGSQATMELAIGRTMCYEATPNMEDTDWFTKGLAYSQHWGNSDASAYHLSVHSNVRWASEVLEHMGFTDITFYEDLNWDRYCERLGPVILEHLNEGASLLIGRAENYYHVPRWGGVRDFNQAAHDNDVFPINITTNGHGEWQAEVMSRTGSGNHLKGYVATTFTWSGPRTLPNSAIWAEMVSTVCLRDLPYGWGYSGALSNFTRYLRQEGGVNFDWFKQNVEAWGEPGIQPWRGVPTIVEVDFPTSITPDTRMIEVQVWDRVEETELADAQVTLYYPGDMPGFNDAEYRTYDEMIMFTKKSDADGMVRFIFDEALFEAGEDLFLTISGRSICPLFEEIEIVTPDIAIDLAEYSISDEDGNDNGEINPGETIALELVAANLGDEATARDVTAVVISLSPWVEVARNEISFGDIEPEETAEGDEAVMLSISSVCPDGESRSITRPELSIEFSSGENTWFSAVKLNPSAPNFEVHRVVGDGIIDYELGELNIELINRGDVDAHNVRARLASRGLGVSVSNNETRYPDIAVDQHRTIAGDPFTVTGNIIVPPGFRNEMMMIISCNDEFIDTAYFELQVNEPCANAPSPPDLYGYMCFDNTDEDWEISPEFEWIEISLRDDDREFNGERIEFEGNSVQNRGEAFVIDLDFTSRLYGYEFDQITVSNHGYICIGDQELVINHQNWPLDRAFGGGVGMIAPFWEDLRLSGDDAGIYYYYDEDNARMIVEWYKLRHVTGGNTDLTFQVIIHDADVWVVDERRNPPLVFQYLSIANTSNVRQGDIAWMDNTPFASVGISSPDGYGINYTYNNQYPVWAAHIENRMALLFTTTPQFKSGCLRGRVIDAETRQPIHEAVIFTEHGFTDRTDEDGYWFIQDALADIPFDITAAKLGYNDSTYTELFLEEDDTLEINFALLHPEFLASDMHLLTMLDPELTVNLPFNIFNEGNGPLEWTMTRRLPGGAERDPWELRLSYPVSETVEDSRVEGVIYIDDRFYVSGANRQGREDGENMIYVLDHDGNEIDRYEQCGNSNYGMRDMAYDGELIWASGERNIYGFYPDDGEVADTIEGSFSSQQALAWDSDRNILWASGITSQYIAGYNIIDHEEVARLPRNDLRIYGLAYWQDDPDDHPLYIFNSPGDGRQVVHKMNPEDGDTMFVSEFQPEDGGSPNGAFATNQFDVYSWVFITISNNGSDDRINIWQIEARRDWFRVFSDIDDDRMEVADGRIESGEEQDFELQLSSVDLPAEITFEGMLNFYHNAEGAETVIDVTLDVIGPWSQGEFGLLYPGDNDSLDANIDTTVITFNWEPSIDPNIEDIVTYLVWFRSGPDSALVLADTDSLTIDLVDLADSLGLSIEVEFPIFWWVKSVSCEDTVDCHRRYCFTFLPNAVIGSGDGIPVEFGIKSIYPSPFNSMTTIQFGVDKPEEVKLNIYDLMGRRVAALYSDEARVGYHNVVWDASALASGLYIVRLESAGRMKTTKAALIR
ncbi:MAG: C25 family cysteine peptidase [Candidatus Hatepunaea meridiana]|nr:C25 family cysteine peptidase [Candidatus Hatepunaea meridiana]